MKKYLITIVLIISFGFAKAQIKDLVGMSRLPEKPDTISIYTSVEQSAEFPGGMRQFSNYLSIEIKYPENSKKLNIQGKVFITFVVERNGTLDQFKVLRGIAPDIDEEAVRVLKASPKWKPGTIHGIDVRQQFTVPINFALAKQ